VSRIVKAMGTDLEPLVLKRSDLRNPPPVAVRRARPHAAGLVAAVQLDEGLERTIAWYREFLA